MSILIDKTSHDSCSSSIICLYCDFPSSFWLGYASLSNWKFVSAIFTILSFVIQPIQSFNFFFFFFCFSTNWIFLSIFKSFIFSLLTWSLKVVFAIVLKTSQQTSKRHVCKINSPRRWSHEEHFMRGPATMACSLAPPFKSPQNQAHCDAQSSLGSRSWWSSHSLLLPGTSCVQWSIFWVPRALLPLIFTVSYAVYGP